MPANATAATMHRAMTAAEPAPATRPALGPNDLGVRVGTDITPLADGTVGHSVVPRGMSVFDDPAAMPTHLRPSSLGGTGHRPIWAMGAAALPQELLLFWGKRGHAVVAPQQVMLLETFVGHIESTADLWTVTNV